jgi:Spy/CpxP family protein refolding chaperone
MKEKVLLLAFVAFSLASGGSRAADLAPVVKEMNPVYVQRAEKIVGELQPRVDGKEKTVRVRDAIAAHYRDVNVIDDAVEARVKELKQQPASEKTPAEIKTVRDEAELKLAPIHAEFLKKLSADLTPEQIDQVKDGMTYGVLQVTWQAYEKMLPDLTAEQKAQILAWLKEAREHALDAGSSEAKHAWFGKYKGRINNYLSKAGYDMKAAEKNLTKKS